MFPKIGKIYGLLMGNSLDSCKRDVTKLRSLIKFDHVKECFDCDTKIELDNLLKYPYNQNDLVIIQYSGHGRIVGKRINGKIEMLSSWVNSHNKKERERDLSITTSDYVDNILNKISCSKILISDSCHSGNFTNFYKSKFPLFFIGSSSIINVSTEYIFASKEKIGVLVALFDDIFSIKEIHDLSLSYLEKYIDIFYRSHKIRVKPVIKCYNLLK